MHCNVWCDKNLCITNLLTHINKIYRFRVYVLSIDRYSLHVHVCNVHNMLLVFTSIIVTVRYFCLANIVRMKKGS